MPIYSLLYLTGYTDVTLDQIKAFRRWGAITAGHPEYGHVAGVETTTGPLGQGIANAVRFAMAKEHLRARWGAKVQDHYTYCIAGDGCLMEGISQEAIGIAGHQRLSRLIVLWDDNGITIDGKVALSEVTDQKARFAASGWDVFACDGYDPADIERAITAAKASPGPAVIACKTHNAIGHAAQDTSKGHGALTDTAQLQAAKDAYGWPGGPFEVPKDINDWWESLGARGAKVHADWAARVAALASAKQAEFNRIFALDVPATLSAAIRAVKKKAVADAPKLATRSALEKVLEDVNPILIETFAGSADLTGSNNTRTADLGVFSAEARDGCYMHWGIREHGMAAAMNGLTLHGGIRPYSGTFMAFTDYARPAMRLSALMGVPVVYVMTHDSIGLGEDGPTHQPVEHLAISRATPNTLVLRPADLVEVAECWEIALSQKTTPSVMALSRQNLAAVRKVHTNQNLSAKGAYVLAEATGKRKVILIATGSEIEIAMKARGQLEATGIGTRVVSMPLMELFAAQNEAYRRKVLPAGPERVAIEAGVRQGWDRWLLGERGREGKAAFVGMFSFGASAPYERLYKEFGISAEGIVAVVNFML